MGESLRTFCCVLLLWTDGKTSWRAKESKAGAKVRDEWGWYAPYPALCHNVMFQNLGIWLFLHSVPRHISFSHLSSILSRHNGISFGILRYTGIKEVAPPPQVPTKASVHAHGNDYRSDLFAMVQWGTVTHSTLLLIPFLHDGDRNGAWLNKLNYAPRILRPCTFIISYMSAG